MRFSKLAGISIGDGEDWFDPIPSQDTPLYVDPYLVFDDEDEHWAGSYSEVVAFFEGAAELVLNSGQTEGTPAHNKAVNLLTFPEPKEFALGFSMSSPDGAGTGRKFAAQIIEVLSLVGKDGAKNLSAISGFSLFCTGVGPDKISDIVCNILKARFIEYTQSIATQHGIPMSSVKIKRAAWDRNRLSWINQEVSLPVTEYGPVLLVPKRFLKDLPPVTPDRFWNWAEQAEFTVLRDDLNYDLSESLNKSQRVKAAIQLARARPDLALSYLAVVDGQKKTAYDVDLDPAGRVQWLEGGQMLAGRATNAGVSVDGSTNPTEFSSWVESLAYSFKHVVEESDGWKLLWDAGYFRHREEKIAQALAGIMWRIECEAANVDISREVDMGRGPVDFKFSQGWRKRAHLEVKYMDNTKFFAGATKQLPQYLRTEKIDYGVYLAIGFTDRDFEGSGKKRVTDACAAMSKEKGIVISPVFVDARPRKPSASKL